MDLTALLPVWIIGAPLLFAVIDFFMTRSDSASKRTHPGDSPGPAPAVAY